MTDTTPGRDDEARPDEAGDDEGGRDVTAPGREADDETLGAAFAGAAGASSTTSTAGLVGRAEDDDAVDGSPG